MATDKKYNFEAIEPKLSGNEISFQKLTMDLVNLNHYTRKNNYIFDGEFTLKTSYHSIFSGNLKNVGISYDQKKNVLTLQYNDKPPVPESEQDFDLSEINDVTFFEDIKNRIMDWIVNGNILEGKTGH